MPFKFNLHRYIQDYRISDPKYVAFAYVGSACMWYGYGQFVAYVPDMSGKDNVEKCSIARLSIMAFVCVTCATLCHSMNIHLRSHVLGIHINSVFWLTAPSLVLHAAGLAPYNHFLSLRVSGWQGASVHSPHLPRSRRLSLVCISSRTTNV